ncbi:hypothetical protein SEA_ODESZA_77 [Gordonia Phage Odesza]|uniref:Uncharacterized protein n=2 Tax=Tanisvirus tanis TaxID=2844677 RepID=A0A7D5JPY8_9CAUD|nr:hypothetical protein SEA_ODESZA_77 [Gordonia Phage Odesza]QKY78747.1 hypothetical protein SEA_GILL_78 [Gordonia phage Gill]QLF83793.1 hypothetical protein SEA_MAGEL_79 [Gordonia phage Magel]
MSNNFVLVDLKHKFHYTFVVVDERKSVEVLRGHTNLAGLNEILTKFTTMDADLKERFNDLLEESRYAEYGAYTENDMPYSIYASYLADPQKTRSPISKIIEEV